MAYRERLKPKSANEWIIEPFGEMNVPVVIYADNEIITDLDDMVLKQACNVASLPGIVRASYAMPDAHWGYGFPIGGVAGFDPDKGGIISAGGVGFDIACGVRTLKSNLTVEDISAVKSKLADALASRIPAGVGSEGKLNLNTSQMDDMLSLGARWAVFNGYGEKRDLEYTEENGCVKGAEPEYVSQKAKERQKRQVGTLGSGNHYLEVQLVKDIFESGICAAYGLKEGDIVVSIHCGSRGLGHQVATDYLPKMLRAAEESGIYLGEKELACAEINSEIAKRYLGAMNCGINCAVANRQVLTSLVRDVFAGVIPRSQLKLLYDVSHNTCKIEEHQVDGKTKRLYVHRKGATRAFGPGHKSLADDIKGAGQPVLIGGTMGTESYILAGTKRGMELALGSCCHGAGRAMSRTKARKRWHGKNIVKFLTDEGIARACPLFLTHCFIFTYIKNILLNRTFLA
jgi:tRNA-splicing ligase RtcB